MKLKDLLEHRRAVRQFDASKPLDTALVRDCLAQAQLAPTSSNMQLWEAYHITSPQLIQQLAPACLDQGSMKTAQEVVVFVVRPDKYRAHAQRNLTFAEENIRATSPIERQESRLALQRTYYGRLMPFVYARCFGLLGALRLVLATLIGLFRPMMRQVGEGDLRTVQHKSCMLAAQTFMLAMAEQGYDTCPLEGFDSWRVRRLLGLPCAAEVSLVVPCGIRTENGVHGDRFRLPFEEIYHRM